MFKEDVCLLFYQPKTKRQHSSHTLLAVAQGMGLAKPVGVVVVIGGSPLVQRVLLTLNSNFLLFIYLFLKLFLLYSPVNTQRPPCAGWASAGRSWCRWNYPTGRKNSSTRAEATKAAFAKRLTPRKKYWHYNGTHGFFVIHKIISLLFLSRPSFSGSLWPALKIVVVCNSLEHQAPSVSNQNPSPPLGYSDTQEVHGSQNAVHSPCYLYSASAQSCKELPGAKEKEESVSQEETAKDLRHSNSLSFLTKCILNYWTSLKKGLAVWLPWNNLSLFFPKRLMNLLGK